MEATYRAEIAAAEGNAARIAEIHRKMQKDLAAIDLEIADSGRKAADKTAEAWKAGATRSRTRSTDRSAAC